MSAADGAAVDAEFVRGLLASQFPRWASLPLTPVAPRGTDHWIFRLGDDLAVRLPRVGRAALQVGKEHAYLPRLAAGLPAAIPQPVGRGRRSAPYPWDWTICSWIEGGTPIAGALENEARLAEQLGRFVAALQSLDARGGPAPGAHNFYRGAPLASRDPQTRRAIDALKHEIDAPAALACWEAALDAPAAACSTWIHGDLQEGNVVVLATGELAGVIDFGGLAVGDPACDLLPAWDMFSDRGRAIFRTVLAPDDAAWARGRGLALSTAAIWLEAYGTRLSTEAAVSWRTIQSVLADDQEVSHGG